MRRILARAKRLLPARLRPKRSGCPISAIRSMPVWPRCSPARSSRPANTSSAPNPVNGIWLGAANDVIMRERGIEFVDGTAPGFAAITGAAPTNEIAVKIARELQEKNIYVFMAGATDGKQFAEQLAEEGVQLGWETRLVPFGKDVSALIYALGFANRSALSFGGVKPGDFKANLKYNKDRIFAFVLAFGEVDAEKYAAAAGAHQLRLPGHCRHRYPADPAHGHMHL